MPGWQEKVVQVMLAETSDLRELARMVGHDPATFWRDANFRQADLSGQDLSGLDISAAMILPPTAQAASEPARGGPDLAVNSKAVAQDHLVRGLKALDRVLADWPRYEAPLATALDAFRHAVDAHQSLSETAGEAEARYRLAEALLLHAYATPEQAKDAIDSAEYELRKATTILESLGDPDAAALCWDARGMALRFKSRSQEDVVAWESLKRVQSLIETLAEHKAPELVEVRTISVIRERIIRYRNAKSTDRAVLGIQLKQLERIWSPVTGPVPNNIKATALIEYSAHRLTLAEVARQPLGPKALEDIRDMLITAMRSASYLDWIDAQRCLTDLDALQQIPEAPPADADASPTLDAARTEALSRAQARLTEGDTHLRALISATDPDFTQLDPALDCYADAEDLYGLLEDVALIEGEPGRAYAILRRGMAHLLKTTDDALTGQAQAEACTDARFALDLAAASLAGRSDVPLALAEALDAQAFGLRIEAHVSTSAAAVEALAEAAALHRRASGVEGLPRAVSYRYRTHAFGAERELEERRSADPATLQISRLRAQKALQTSDSRRTDRTSAAEEAAYMAMLAEYAMSVTAELKLAAPADVKAQRAQSKEATDQTLQEAMALAATLFMPLDWMLLRRARAQLRRIDAR
ncbi:hypothetical protein [uncultured Roseobacter sp.]|uniref:hypothetical protein n=1 Tax=uncultured Roseobacter sp. TaxID=114847 RepID=UPI0026325611|nr:hypothetical protein [uncultured Roseobacter sp.]